MKIAAVSDDGVTISTHFGQARQFVVLTVLDGKVVSRETREKVADARPAVDQGTALRDPHDHFAGYRVGPRPRSRHDEMAAAIGDCEVVLTGEMSVGAFNALSGYGIEPIITDIEEVDSAVQAYLDSTIQNLTERLR